MPLQPRPGHFLLFSKPDRHNDTVEKKLMITSEPKISVHSRERNGKQSSYQRVFFFGREENGKDSVSVVVFNDDIKSDIPLKKGQWYLILGRIEKSRNGNEVFNVTSVSSAEPRIDPRVEAIADCDPFEEGISPTKPSPESCPSVDFSLDADPPDR